jgi:AcrR family transcriptional regulator
MTESERQRRDVARNHEAILDAAGAILADTPQASMNEIAAASGLGRATLYRHFPDRAALITSLHEQVRERARAIVHEELDHTAGRDPIDVLTDLALAIADVGDQFRFLMHQEDAQTHGSKRRRREDEAGEPLRRFIAAAQREGSITAELDPEWLTEVYSQLFIAAIKHKFPEPDGRRAALAVAVRRLMAPD